MPYQQANQENKLKTNFKTNNVNYVYISPKAMMEAQSMSKE